MKGSQVLIIEDNASNRELLRYLLSSFGHIPLLADSGELGLDMARQLRPDLIICDIQMPGMDGFDVARHLKQDESTRHIPLVAVTAFAMLGDRERVLAAGFDAYISKPIEPEATMVFLESLLAARQTATSITSPHYRPGVRVLVVDDRDINLTLKRSVLEPLGYEVWTARTMQQALASMRHTRPDLIISDINMGGEHGNGFDFIQIVKSEPLFRSIPFIFITSTFHDSQSRSKALQLGAARFIVRPIDPESLLQEIESCLNEHSKD